MNNEQLEAIRKRAKHAIVVPWDMVGDIVFQGNGVLMGAMVAECDDEITAEFIANTSKDIPALLAEVERLRKENEKYEGALSQIAHGDTWTAYPHDIAAWALGLK